MISRFVYKSFINEHTTLDKLIHIHAEIKVRNKIQHLNDFIFTVMSNIIAPKTLRPKHKNRLTD